MLLDLKDYKIYLYDITFVILTILSITFTGIYCIDIIVPLSPLSNSRTFHHLSQKKSCPHQQSPPSPPLAPDNQEPTLCVCGSACSGRFPSVESHPVCPSVSASLTEHCIVRVRPRGSECQRISLSRG